MGEINWTEDAEEDLKNIFNYVRQHSELNAHRLINRIIDRAFILTEQPFSGHIGPEFKNNQRNSHRQL